VDFDHLWSLEDRGVNWVTRAKENLQFEVVENYRKRQAGCILSNRARAGKLEG
jgi:hypothetical protein